ncbi:MAG: cation:proton antiporter [bacterium]|nr:cation:proton antiporter [bacterium]
MAVSSNELYYILLLFALFIVPRVLQRFRLPSAITCVGLGAVAGLGLELFHGDGTVQMLATLGIVALFLFAGLDVDFVELYRHRGIVAQHLALFVGSLALVTVLAVWLFKLDLRPAMLVALALITPSTGFILDSLHSLGLSEQERFWIRTKAIASEIVALLVLFFVLQTTTVPQFAKSLGIMAGLVILLPLLFKMFADWILPYAPRTEFTFMVIVAVAAAFVTLRLGVYYLVGAFIVGLVAHRFQHELPALASDKTMHALELFASFFIPFYFFSAGLHLERSDFSPLALLVGGGFILIMVPLRLLPVALHRRMVLKEPLKVGMRISASMLPTLVFTLVLAGILRDRFDLPGYLFGGLIVYTLANTLIPGFALGISPSSFMEPKITTEEFLQPRDPSAKA